MADRVQKSERARERAGRLEALLQHLESEGEPRSARLMAPALSLQLLETERAETIGQLAGGVAHDLANLLVPIISYSELALDELDEDAPLFYDIEQILESARYARELTSQLLDFCRCRLPASRSMNLNDSVNSARNLLHRLLAENIVLDLHLTAELDDITADPARIDQILINMTVNARDAMIDGGRFTVETANVVIDPAFIARHPGATLGPKVMISFTDTGCGIPPADMPYIFDRFFTTKAEGGTGLGLCTVRGIADEYGAFIDVISSPGHGTCFKLFFPVSVVRASAVEGAPDEEPGRGNGETVLVMSLDDTMRRLIGRILTRFGYNVVEAASPEDAVQCALSLKDEVALIISELSLSGMSGATLVGELQILIPSVRVLFMSGQERDSRPPPPPSLEVLARPFTVNELASRVWQILHDRDISAETDCR